MRSAWKTILIWPHLWKSWGGARDFIQLLKGFYMLKDRGQLTQTPFFRISLAFPQSIHYWHLSQNNCLAGWASNLVWQLKRCIFLQELHTLPVHVEEKGLCKLLQEIRASFPVTQKELCAHSWGLHFWSQFTFPLTSLQGLEIHSTSSLPNQILLLQFPLHVLPPPALSEHGSCLTPTVQLMARSAAST